MLRKLRPLRCVCKPLIQAHLASMEHKNAEFGEHIRTMQHEMMAIERENVGLSAALKASRLTHEKLARNLQQLHSSAERDLNTMLANKDKEISVYKKKLHQLHSSTERDLNTMRANKDKESFRSSHTMRANKKASSELHTSTERDLNTMRANKDKEISVLKKKLHEASATNAAALQTLKEEAICRSAAAQAIFKSHESHNEKHEGNGDRCGPR